MQLQGELFNQKEDLAFITGRVIQTVFHNPTNLYSVVRIRISATNTTYDEKEAVITGYLPAFFEEDTYTFYGKFTSHPKFGKQFAAERFKKEVPKSRQGIINYLSSNLFKGIGIKTAEAIVDKLGDDTISLIMTDPFCLEKVKGLKKEKAKVIYDTIVAHQGLEQAIIVLNECGFGPMLSMKIYQVYKEKTVDIVQNHPYQLVETVDGIGFARADALGRRLGITFDHPERIRAGVKYVLEQRCVTEGHCYMELRELLDETKTLLEEKTSTQIDFTLIAKQIVELERDKLIIGEDKKVYLPYLYYSEVGLVKHIRRLLTQEGYKEQFPESEILLALGRLEEKIKVTYAPSQKEAIFKALTSPMLILTGGPGTGKTTVIKGIVEMYADLHGKSLNPKDYKDDEVFPFLLTAPTGRAAKRMSESTGLPAVTIHRLLGWNGTEGFDYNEDQPLRGKIIIIDETSMVDIWIAYSLFQAIPSDCQVIIVGDEDQLPSVGPGQVLKDLLASQTIPSVRLVDIYRQEEGSTIIELAHEMKHARLPANILQNQKDRSFFACSATQVVSVVQQVVTSAHKKGYSSMDIQVLAPMYKGPAGIDVLNKEIQEILNPNPNQSKKEIVFNNIAYRIGDKVLQLVNMPEKQVFNGDIGTIVSINLKKENDNQDTKDEIIISYDGNEVAYEKSDLTQITLAYCCSVHKSQGSEFPIVIIPVVKSYYRMLRKNLLYTAITRAKKSLVLCGEIESLEFGVKREDESQRNTFLIERLQKELTPVVVIENAEISYEQQFELADPMIGMDGVSPYDYM